jgi:hypothetical protein
MTFGNSSHRKFVRTNEGLVAVAGTFSVVMTLSIASTL